MSPIYNVPGMNPITHALTGWLIAQPAAQRRDRALITLAAVIPDADGLAILGGERLYGEWHHTFGHNVFAAVVVTVACALLGRDRIRTGALAVLAFHSHLLGDVLGSGAVWPIQYFWPVSRVEWSTSPPFQWELVSWQNTAFTVACLFAVGAIGVRLGRTIVEVLSLRADVAVVSTLRRRFRPWPL